MNPQNAVEEGLRDIKPPQDFPANYLWLKILCGVIIALLAFFLIRYLGKRYARRKDALRSLPKSAYTVAMEALAALQAKGLEAAGRVKEFYIELSDIVRRYLESRFSLRAPEMTTEEVLYSLRESGELTGAQKNLLKEFLQRCDLVKFAKYGPTQQEAEESFNAAERLVKETTAL